MFGSPCKNKMYINYVVNILIVKNYEDQEEEDYSRKLVKNYTQTMTIINEFEYLFSIAFL